MQLLVARRSSMCNYGLQINDPKECAMEAIRHRIGVETPIEAFYDAVATHDGVAGWWTRQIEGESRVSGQLAFFFGGDEPSAVMDVVELTAPQRVVWRCAE